MTYPCPHCRERTIGFWAKWLSGNLRTARCPACGGGSEVRATTARQCSAAALVVGGLAVMGFVLGQGHPGWLAVGALAAAGVYALAWHWARLLPAAADGRKLGRDWLPSAFAVIVLAIWWLGRNG